jgi:DNA-binding GntR family transcriptional regulator
MRDEKIALIKDYADGAELSQRKLCEKYKVSKGVVYNILQRIQTRFLIECEQRCRTQTARRVGSQDR